MFINTNTSAALASYNLSSTNRDYQRNLTKLSSGSRINSSSDDAGGLAVSMKMNAQIRRADAHAVNLSNSLSFLQTQDSALKQLGNLLQRMSELKALAQDVTKNSGDVGLYEKEYIQLQEQFVQITTEKFNGIHLFGPTSVADPLYVNHYDRGDTTRISRPALGDLHSGDALNIGGSKSIYSVVSGRFTWFQAKAHAEARGEHLVTITSPDEWNKVLSQAPDANNKTLWIGAYQRDFSKEPAGNWEWVTGEPWAYTNWLPGEPNNYRNRPEHYAIANAVSGKWNDNQNGASTQGYLSELELSFSLLDLPWSDLHATIQKVATARAQNGAEQMQLQMATDLNATNTVNIEQALGRIQDVDMAQATSDLARMKVLIEAGTAMLAQANQSHETILRLIM